MSTRVASLIKVENVLSRDGLSGPLTDAGQQMLRMLQSTGQQIFFLTEEEMRSKVIAWLYSEAYLRPDTARIIDAADDDPITTVRYLGWEVQFYIDSDPSRVAYAMDKGVTSLLMAAPEYQRPEFRPNYRGPVRAWDTLIDAIAKQKEQRSADARIPDDFQDARFGE